MNGRRTWPRSSSSSRTRSTAFAGSAIGVPRASAELFKPRTAPDASTSGPPENPSYTARSSRRTRSIRAPCQVRHPSPTALMMPKLAETFFPGRPTASTSDPTRSELESAFGAARNFAPAPATLNATRSVAGSRPATVATAESPLGSAIGTSSSRRTV